MIKPLYNYLVLEELKPSETLETNGLVLQEKVNMDLPALAKVIDMGPDCKPVVNVGDTVLVQRHLFNETIVDKKEYIIGKDEALVAIYTK